MTPARLLVVAILTISAGIAVAQDAGPAVDGGVAEVPVEDRQDPKDDTDPKDDKHGKDEQPHPNESREWDVDGDGAVDGGERELERHAEELFADVSAEATPGALAERPKHKQLGVRSLTVKRFRAMVAVTRAKVLARITARIEHHTSSRMIALSQIIAVCSLSGVLLLLLPLFLRRRYPNRQRVLFQYSAVAAVTFMLTVGLFGAVALIERGAHGAMARFTNPQLALANGFFDTLDDDAPQLVVVGKEVFAPTLVQLQGRTEAQPTTLLFTNGRKVVKDAEVFVEIADAFRRISFVIEMIPSVLLVVSMLLFLSTIRPTVMSIVELPVQAASAEGASGSAVFAASMRKVGAELLATLASLGVLIAISVLAGTALGRVIQPAVATLIGYFTVGVLYLKFIEDASSALVLVMMFSVILFLVLNLLVIVVATAFYVVKSQRIFHQRFSAKVPLATHRRFWKWGTIAVLWTLVFPFLYMTAARAGIKLINQQVMAGRPDPEDVPWLAFMLTGPLLLIAGFVVAMWLSRTFAAIKFLIRYPTEGGESAAVFSVAEAAAASIGRA